MPNPIDNIIIQVRSKLQRDGIKLWLEPYYFEGIGPIEAEIERLANDFSACLGISLNNCKLALSELQDGALRKLESKKEFESTGIATFHVRTVRKTGGTENLSMVKCALSSIGRDLMQAVAEKFNVNDACEVKVISAGRVVKPERILREQGLVNNQQLMVLISESDSAGNKKGAMYERVQKIKNDVQKMLSAKNQSFLEMEDQDGNAIHLPPDEQRAIMTALAFYEKGRVAMKKEQFDEALILLLEADEHFAACSSNILETVDNYALLNLEIVWCYLCLKNVTQLPDAQRRLDICEKNFRRSYGENMNRVMTLKGSAGNERALVMRLHLLQGVLFFHQNRRNEAHERLSLAESELRCLKVDEGALTTLVEMGYDVTESRIALRSCNGNISEAITFIIERRRKKKEARQKARKEREVDRQLPKLNKGEWVNPRSVVTLVEMGFQRELATAALLKTDNDLSASIDLLQSNPDSLLVHMPKHVNADQALLKQLEQFFGPDIAKIALEATYNDLEKAIDFLLSLHSEDGCYEDLLSNMAKFKETGITEASATSQPGPSTSTASGSDASSNVMNLIKTVKKKVDAELEVRSAYKRFAKGMSNDDDDYLDLTLLQEEAIIVEYKGFLEQ